MSGTSLLRPRCNLWGPLAVAVGARDCLKDTVCCYDDNPEFTFFYDVYRGTVNTHTTTAPRGHHVKYALFGACAHHPPPPPPSQGCRFDSSHHWCHMLLSVFSVAAGVLPQGSTQAPLPPAAPGRSLALAL